MSFTQLRIMDEIESWRQKILVYEAESLKIEQANEMKFDSNRDDIYRSLFYGLSASLGSMIESMQETMEEPSELTQTSQQELNIDNSNTADENGRENQHFLFGIAKVETLEFQNELSLDEAVAFDLEELKSETSMIENNADNALEEITSNEVNITEPNNSNNNRSAEEENTKIKVDRDEIEQVVNIAAHSNFCYHEFQPTHKRFRSSIIPSKNCVVMDGSPATVTVSAVTTPKAAKAGIFGCDNCERKFRTPNALKSHYSQFHIAQTTLKCGDCGCGMKSREKLLQHDVEVHPGKSAKEAKSQSNAYTSLKCTHCRYTASGYAILRTHMRKHSGEKPFLCSECPQKFATSSNFYLHVRNNHADKTEND
ncbi:hypothetical protein PRIPAC_75294 [Pristionchus pacificus]|uniref:Uncharacterized protein n=1 Tax=Pristionchus pacificus TaxID=54126 RepID=A0A2A6C8W1_PRIPA|nr:hypothetical protein PRIPAC_75294 [Pristionchus pacificus]|eukprot:PDM74483.1 hypothetical protein PRIPAC_41839 [Pristionchus pacificus]